MLLCAALAILAVPAAASAAQPKYPTIKKVSPLHLAVGQQLTITGTGYRVGKNRTTIVFQRDGARAIFAKARLSTAKKAYVVVPASVLPYLRTVNGKPVATRFRLRVLAARLSKLRTAASLSPMIAPSAGPVIAAPSMPLTPVPAAPVVTATDVVVPLPVQPAPAQPVVEGDCDADGIVNSKDPDDDGDLLPDVTETSIGTNPCNADSDGDGMTDGWEQLSARDRNSTALPSPVRKPYPNALDPTDGASDQDGDALTNFEEYAAWATYGGHRVPLSYSGGNPASAGRDAVAAALAYMDRDGNGFLSDNERDADGDAISNQDEGTLSRPVQKDVVGFFDPNYIAIPAVHAEINTVPLYGPLPYTAKADPLEWLVADTDGDGVKDGADDQDHDDIANLQELKAELAQSAGARRQDPLNACSPNRDSRGCILANMDPDHDGLPNAQDDDDDNDRLLDEDELALGLRADDADTDGDGVGDGFEVHSARDLNGFGTPYPRKLPYPNALDPSDANKDFDGDGLDLAEEYAAWSFLGAPKSFPYSDGTKWSLGQGTNAAEKSSLRDDNRDVDQDGLTNGDESGGTLVGPMSPAWWTAIFDKETPYYGPEFAATSMTHADTDGDEILDGADDQDHDGFPNWFEVHRDGDWSCRYTSMAHPEGSTDPLTADDPCAGALRDKPLARVNPFNPCKPITSDACHTAWPRDYYPSTEDWQSDKVADDAGTTPPDGPVPTYRQ